MNGLRITREKTERGPGVPISVVYEGTKFTRGAPGYVRVEEHGKSPYSMEISRMPEEARSALYPKHD